MSETLLITLVSMLLVLIDGIVTFSCGIYQLISGKESFLMSAYRKKYNYEKYQKQFIQLCGVLDLIGGSLILSLLVLQYLSASISEILLLSVPVLCIMGIVRRIMLWRYTDNLENRRE